MEYAPEKKTTEVLDYCADYTAQLIAGETIDTSTWTVDAGLTVDNDTDFDASKATIIVSGGTGGVDYMMKNTITTNQSRTYTKNIILPVLEAETIV